MDIKETLQLVNCWAVHVGNFGLLLVWYLVHFLVSLWYFALGVVHALESYLVSSGLFKIYQPIDISKIRYLAIVIDSDDARQTTKVVKLLKWLIGIGVKNVCLYDAEGLLKKSKESILNELDEVRLFEETDETDRMLHQKHVKLEFASFTDGKEAVAKAANLLFQKYLKLGDTCKTQQDQLFTESQMSEALRDVGCGGPDPDLLLVYAPIRCHLGFPAWRIRYTEIIHMGPLNSMKYGALLKAVYKFTRVHQNYGT